jgi:hypothetical protein
MNPIPGFRAIQFPENRTVARGWKGCWRRAQDSMQATSYVTMQTLADVVGHQLLDRPPLLQGPLLHLLHQVIGEVECRLHDLAPSTMNPAYWFPGPGLRG